MSNTIPIGSARHPAAPLRSDWVARVGRAVLGILKRKRRVPEKPTFQAGHPMPVEVDRFRQELELKIARIHFYARLPL